MSVIAATASGAARHPSPAASSAFVSARPDAKKSHGAGQPEQSAFVAAKPDAATREAGATTGQTLDVKL